MAKQRIDQELFDRLRANGLRKRVAQTVAGAVGAGRGATSRKPPAAVMKVVGDLRGLASELEDRATGGPAKRKAAAKKAAATRKRAAAKRSAAAKKGARTRARAKAKS
jgi:hypothetical protein